jgi:glutamyl-tRNA reductase
MSGTQDRPKSQAGRRIAPEAAPGMDALRLLSIHHRTAPLEELERMALSAPALDALHRAFRDRRLEAVAMSTCNRTELYWISTGADADDAVEALLFDTSDDTAPARDHFVEKRGVAAAEHLFRVASGLESLVVGEAEILGQVRDAIELADRYDTSGSLLSGLFRAALRCGGRARQETAIGTGALSVASAGIQHLDRIHTDLTRSTVLVIGAGMTGLKAARHLRAERVGRLVILNRTTVRAEEVAAELGAIAAPLEDLPRWLAEADAVVAAAQVESPLVTVDMVRAAQPERRERPLVLIDLSMPRAIDAACGAIPGVVHHDLSGLEQVVARNRAGREREIPRAEALVEREMGAFVRRVTRPDTRTFREVFGIGATDDAASDA